MLYRDKENGNFKERVYVTNEIDGNGVVLRTSTRRYKYFDDKHGYLFKPNSTCIKSFPGFSLPDDLSDTDTARMYRLSFATHSKSNLIYRRSGNNIKPQSKQDIARYLGVSPRQGVEFVNRMLNRGILGKVDVTVAERTDTHFYVNPIYFFNGKWLSHNLYFIFKNELDSVLQPWVVEEFNKVEKVVSSNGLQGGAGC